MRPYPAPEEPPPARTPRRRGGHLRAVPDERVLLPGKVRLQLQGYKARPCPLTRHHAALAAPNVGLGRPRTPHCVACLGRGRVWLHEDLLATDGALERLAWTLRGDAKAGSVPLGLGLLGDEVVYGHAEAVRPT